MENKIIEQFVSSAYDWDLTEAFYYEVFGEFRRFNTKYFEPDTKTEAEKIKNYSLLGIKGIEELGFFDIVVQDKINVENNRTTLHTVLKQKASDNTLDAAIAI